MDELVVLPPRSISATTEFALPSPPEMRNRMFENLAFEICLIFFYYRRKRRGIQQRGDWSTVRVSQILFAPGEVKTIKY